MKRLILLTENEIMITHQNAMDKALDYLKVYDILVVITLHG